MIQNYLRELKLKLDSIKEFKKKIDLVKIDVEGYEIEVLLGMEKILDNIK